MNKQSSRSILVLLCAIIIGSVSAVAQPAVLDRIAAVVGKEAILLSDVNAQVEFYIFNNKVDPNTPGLKQQVLDGMINEKLILAKALEDTTINVTDDEVNNQLDALITQRIQQFGSEERLAELYHMPVSRMKHEWRDGMRKQILASKLWDAKNSSINVSRREVEEFFAQYKDSLPRVPEELELYNIFRFPKVSAAAKERIRVKAQTIFDSIKAGGDFADFARRHSEDLGSAASGGDLGFARRGQYVKEFEEAVFSLKESQFANIIETSFGFHIIQLLERRGESVHARHILFKIERDSSDTDSTIAFLKGLKDSVAHGASFSNLAKRYSEDKESGPLGGFMGKFSTDQFEKSLLETVKNLKEGDISDPVEAPSGPTTGYHIIWLTERVPEHTMNLAEDWKRLEQLATTYKRNSEYQKWITQLRSEIYWNIKL